MLMVATVIPPATANSEPRAAVGTIEDGFHMVVLCKRVDAAWEPICGIKGGRQLVTLPACFSLCDEAVNALNAAYAEGV
jgi:hypothetical protein